MSPTLTPTQTWWTAEEIAAAALPDLPATKRGVNLTAAGWRADPAHARRRAGKGGGWEYSWKLFPSRAQRKLLQSAVARPALQPSRDEVWAWFEKLPKSVQDKARAKLAIIQQVEAFEPLLGQGRHMAVVAIAKSAGVGARTVWTWFDLVVGVRADDRLPHLAPRHRAAVRKPKSKDCDPEFFTLIKSDYLRLEAPPFTDSYRRAVQIAGRSGLAMLPERTMRRRLDAAVSEVTQILAREGIEAVKRKFPAQVRDKTALVALEAVNADCHKFDVFVRWPVPKGVKELICRPQMITFQDIHSGRILAWRLDLSPNSTAVMLAAGDMIEDWGIPQHILFDNGREFAAKAITGGATTRYRFKVKDEDIPGLFTALDCKIHFATPYHGQAKPIERAFRDMCQSIAKDPRFAGAYVGHKTDAKPENYGSRAIDLNDFIAVVAKGIEEHNTRQGRRSEVAWGRSFAEVFDESYGNAPILRATEAQRRLWLLGADAGTARADTGSVWFQGNEFWDAWMQEIAGKRVIIRFDPAAFWDGIHVYGADNAYLGFAPCRQKVGFFDADAAKFLAQTKSAWLKAEKAKLLALERYTAAQLGQMLDEATPEARPRVEAKVVKPIFGRGKAERAARGTNQVSPADDVAQAQEAIIVDLASRQHPQPVVSEETERERFGRALDLEQRIATGGAVTHEQARWLAAYQTTPECRAERQLWTDFGEAYLA